MTTKISISKDYSAAYKNPIRVRSGELVTVREEYQGEPGWRNWIWCIHSVTGKEGWVPKQYLEINGTQAKVLVDFNARELTVRRGDRIRKIASINGWVWVERNREYGWIPEDCLAEGASR